MKGLPSLNLPCFVFLYFWYLLSSVRWYLLVILIYTSLRITDIEHLSHINASNLYILFWKGLLEPVTYTFFFLNQVICFYTVEWLNFLKLCQNSFIKWIVWNYLSHSIGEINTILSMISIPAQRLDAIKFDYFCFWFQCFWVYIQETWVNQYSGNIFFYILC